MAASLTFLKSGVTGQGNRTQVYRLRALSTTPSSTIVKLSDIAMLM